MYLIAASNFFTLFHTNTFSQFDLNQTFFHAIAATTNGAHNVCVFDMAQDEKHLFFSTFSVCVRLCESIKIKSQQHTVTVSKSKARNLVRIPHS